MTAKIYGTKIIIALFLILTMNTDRALPPSIAFSAMMTPMMTDFKKFCFGHLRAADRKMKAIAMPQAGYA
jgi:hypothetical protein